MKTLLERLKPEYLEMLENEKKQYPVTVEVFKEKLNNIHSWLQITYENLIYINNTFKVEIDVTKISNLFYE